MTPREPGSVTPTDGGIEVLMGWHEALETAIEGLKRSLRHDYDGLTHRAGKRQDAERRWGTDVEGTCAERAFARAMRLYWAPSPGRQTGPSGDVAGWEVRWTHLANGRLIVRPGDHGERPYVLVTGAWPTYTLRGYLVGKEAMQDRYADVGDATRARCWMVPQSDLIRLTGQEGPWRGGWGDRVE